MIELREIYKEFKYGDSVQGVLNGINLDIKDGDFITIMGKSGSGKTTLLNHLALLLEPSKGKIIFNNKEVNFKKESEVNTIRKKHYGLIFQNPNLIPCLNPLENVLIASDKDDKKTRNIAIDLLNKVGLADKIKCDVKALSGGEAQRVAIVRALINEPDIILCDEPTGALDEKNSKNIIDLLLDIKKEKNCSLIIVTHDNLIGELGSRRLIIEEGKVNEL